MTPIGYNITNSHIIMDLRPTITQNTRNIHYYLINDINIINNTHNNNNNDDGDGDIITNNANRTMILEINPFYHYEDNNPYLPRHIPLIRSITPTPTLCIHKCLGCNRECSKIVRGVANQDRTCAICLESENVCYGCAECIRRNLPSCCTECYRYMQNR